jgi:hypothetical protein
MNTEEWKVAAASKSVEIAAGVCHTVDLVKGIGKKRNAHGLHSNLILVSAMWQEPI